MIEYMIRTCDGNWFDLHRNQLEAVLKPSSFASRPIEGWGHHRIDCEGAAISFSYEDPEIQICFESGITEQTAKQIVEETRESMQEHTNLKGHVMSLAGDKPILF